MNPDDILVHFYPGNNNSPAQAARYVGKNKLRLPTGELVQTKQPGIDLFPSSTFYFPTMDELVMTPPEGFVNKLIHFFKSIHSIIGFKWWWGIELSQGDSDKQYRFSNGYTIDQNKRSCGQQTDVQEFIKTNQEINENPALKHKPRIYMGVSRGAAATFSALATEGAAKNVKLCILEGPPSSISGLFKHIGRTWLFSGRVGKWIYQHFADAILGKRHRTDKASQARGHVDKFPDDIPLLIVSSKKDGVVPIENSIRLALRVAVKRQKALEENPKANIAPVYFLPLESVGHNQYATSGTKDSENYQHVVHAICKKHGLPFDAKSALLGEKLMNESNLMGENSKALLKLQSRFWEDKEHRASIRCEAKNLQEVSNIFQYAPLFRKPLPRPEIGLADKPTNAAIVTHRSF